MKMSSLFTAVLLTFALAYPAAAQSSKASSKGTSKAGGAGRTIKITGTEQMKFDVTTITAKPGESLHVVLTAVGSMPKIVMSHNFVVLEQGTDPLAFVTAGSTHQATDYIAPESKKDVIAATGMAGGGETVAVTFKAPTKPGEYTYICTFPGHLAAGMKGTLTVK
jgi:azurin